MSLRLNEVQTHLSEAKKLQLRSEDQLRSILHISQKFIEAGNEREIIETILQESISLTGAMGASFVSLDDRGQPLAAIRKGDFPFPIPDAWLEYLASPMVRRGCQQCSLHENHDHTCALLRGPFSDAIGLYCFPLKYGHHDLGILNLYMPEIGQLSEQTKLFLHSLVDATALALESERFRQRELATFSQLHTIRNKSDLFPSLTNMVENLHQTISSDFAMLVLTSFHNQPDYSLDNFQLDDRNVIISGDIKLIERDALEKLIRLILLNNQIESSDSGRINIPSVSSWVAVPLVSMTKRVLGILIAANSRIEYFHRRYTVLIQGVAEQMALLIQNTVQISDLEYKVMIDERTRLAREIHDGLAQTLGFLKLQVAQMLGYLERDEKDRLARAMRVSYDTLSTAYHDARLAIDGLRITPGNAGEYQFETWLSQTVEEFSSSGDVDSFPITVEELDVQTQLPPEVHAQLIRIVQEAFSNVRKHANAKQAWISCVQNNSDIILEIRDDGKGFDVADVPGFSRYGLRGMRERAELIGADFQVISRPGEGTTVRVRLPLQVGKHLEV